MPNATVGLLQIDLEEELVRIPNRDRSERIDMPRVAERMKQPLGAFGSWQRYSEGNKTKWKRRLPRENDTSILAVVGTNERLLTRKIKAK